MELLLVAVLIWFVGMLPAFAVYLDRIDTHRSKTLCKKYGNYRGGTLVGLDIAARTVTWPFFLIVKYIVGMVKGK